MIFTHNPIVLSEIEADTQDGKRVYTTPDGKKYPSATTVLAEHSKKGIMEWRKRVGDEEANRIGQKATSGGSRFHTITEQYLKNEPPDIKNLVELERFAYYRPLLDRIDNIVMQETGLWSHHLRMAGRVDCVAEFDGKLSIIDFKTSLRTKQKSYIENYFMQASAYAIMFEERTQIPVPNLVILISVEDDRPQIFEEKRNNWVEKLLYYRDLYESNNSQSVL